MSLNLACILETSARRYPEQTALIRRRRSGGDLRVSYRELRDSARRVASALLGLGVKPADRVALMLPNVPEFTIAYFGILLAGATVVPLNTLFVADEIGYHLRDSDAVVLVAWEELEAVAREGMAQAENCRQLVLAGRPGTRAPADAHD